MCDAKASTVIYWPGREPLAMCTFHANACVRIGGAIGCHVHTSTLMGEAQRCASEDPTPDGAEPIPAAEPA